MNIKRNGINLLLVAEGLLLVAVLVLGLLSGAAGAITGGAGNTEDNHVSQNTEHESGAGTEDVSGSELESETESEVESETEPESQPGPVIPENYVESRITFSDTVEAMLAQMTMEQKVAQLFIVSPEALTGYNQVTVFGNASRNAFNQYPVGGLAYSSHNFQGNTQMQKLINDAQSFYTTTFGKRLFTMTSDGLAEDMATRVQNASSLGYNILLVEGDGATLTAGHTAIAGGNISSALCNAPATIEGYETAIDTGASVIVLDNAIAAAVTGDEITPCCLSNRTVGLLRESMGYEGVIMTDNMSDATFVETYGSTEACVAAIQAGVDIIYMPADFVNSYNAVLQAALNGDISVDRLENAVGRILTAKGV